MAPLFILGIALALAGFLIVRAEPKEDRAGDEGDSLATGLLRRKYGKVQVQRYHPIFIQRQPSPQIESPISEPPGTGSA